MQNEKLTVESFVQRRHGGDLTVHGIKDAQGRWFAWCYVSEKVAKGVMLRLNGRHRTSGDLAANWKEDPQKCTLSDRK
jgi:hypothetical protein